MKFNIIIIIVILIYICCYFIFPPDIYILQSNISDFNFKLVNPVINSSAVLRKELANWKEEFAGVEDYELWVRLRRANKRFYNFEDVLVKHRVHPSSAFNTQDHSAKIALIKEY
jgi:hypothetical protein